MITLLRILCVLFAVLSIHFFIVSLDDAFNKDNCNYAAEVAQTIYANEHLYSSPQAMLNALEPHTNYLMENCND